MATLNITQETSQQTSSDNMEHGPHYSMYYTPDHFNSVTNTFEKPLMYQELIANAHHSIKIWDPYVHNDSNQEALIMQYVQNAIELTFLLLYSGQNKQRLESIADFFYNKIPAAYQNGSIVRFAYIDSDLRDNKTRYALHDRFLIIDDTRYFIIGSSITYHLQSASTSAAITGIYEVTDPSDINIIREKFEDYYHVAVADNTVIVK